MDEDKKNVHISIAESTKLRNRHASSNSTENEKKQEVACSSESVATCSKPNSLQKECKPDTETHESPGIPYKKGAFYALFSDEEPFFICQFLEHCDTNFKNGLRINWFDKNKDGNYCFEREDNIVIYRTVLKEAKLEKLGEGVYKLSSKEKKEIKKLVDEVKNDTQEENSRNFEVSQDKETNEEQKENIHSRKSKKLTSGISKKKEKAKTSKDKSSVGLDDKKIEILLRIYGPIAAKKTRKVLTDIKSGPNENGKAGSKMPQDSDHLETNYSSYVSQRKVREWQELNEAGQHDEELSSSSSSNSVILQKNLIRDLQIYGMEDLHLGDASAISHSNSSNSSDVFDDNFCVSTEAKQYDQTLVFSLGTNEEIQPENSLVSDLGNLLERDEQSDLDLNDTGTVPHYNYGNNSNIFDDLMTNNEGENVANNTLDSDQFMRFK